MRRLLRWWRLRGTETWVQGQYPMRYRRPVRMGSWWLRVR